MCRTLLQNAFTVACDANYYGAVGQLCLPCPIGATCDGFVPTLQPPAARFVDPIPSAGYFNLNGSMASACPAAIAIPGRASCIVPCVPASACASANLCSDGYVSNPPYYRCASCATGYYQLGTVCAQCPNSPLALIVGIALAFIVRQAGREIRGGASLPSPPPSSLAGGRRHGLLPQQERRQHRVHLHRRRLGAGGGHLRRRGRAVATRRAAAPPHPLGL